VPTAQVRDFSGAPFGTKIFGSELAETTVMFILATQKVAFFRERPGSGHFSI